MSWRIVFKILKNMNLATRDATKNRCMMVHKFGESIWLWLYQMALMGRLQTAGDQENALWRTPDRLRRMLNMETEDYQRSNFLEEMSNWAKDKCSS